MKVVSNTGGRSNVINTWNKDEKLTWDALCDKLVKNIGKRPSRQSLSSHIKVADCFNSKKKLLKAGVMETNVVKPANLQIACERIKRLETENKALMALNNKYLEQFKIWLYNAHLKQITVDDLNYPLPKKDI
ncbi:hypothetical protein [Erwinia tracheiphila]|uniref:Uncharacterized protein n=2 Tax=Erwinia tracheiphila TaxID=65700 RepID=A0A0M2KE12_9GAMM|nr:hypothetical protein [Erwinia tracheiphila]KKF35542.1 hypothetical protein SY86_09045 [Erwinia tracheiphila]